MPQTLDDLRREFGGKWYDFGAKEQRLGAQSPGAGWMRAPRIDPTQEVVWHPQYGWQRWKDVKKSGGNYSGFTPQFGNPYEIYGYKTHGAKKHGIYRPGPGAAMPQPAPQPQGPQPQGPPVISPDTMPSWEIPGMRNIDMGMQAQMGGFNPQRFNYGGGYGIQQNRPQYQYPGGGF